MKTPTLKFNYCPTKREVEELFNRHNLHLGFPAKATSGHTVTDWELWHHRTSYENSELKRFENIIRQNYTNQYKIVSCGVGGSVGLIKVKPEGK